MRIIAARRTVPHPRHAVFEFLADLENHWRLSPRFEVVSLDRDDEGAAVGGTVRVRGPLLLRRTVRTRVAEVDPPNGMEGEAVVDSTHARVRWTLSPEGDQTLVQLAVCLERSSWKERMLFACGGASWLQRQFAAVLQTLDDEVRARRA